VFTSTFTRPKSVPTHPNKFVENVYKKKYISVLPTHYLLFNLRTENKWSSNDGIVLTAEDLHQVLEPLVPTRRQLDFDVSMPHAPRRNFCFGMQTVVEFVVDPDGRDGLVSVQAVLAGEVFGVLDRFLPT
jgi:hypothetical protein